MTRRDEVSEQIQQYAICSEDLHEVGNHLQECDDDAYDTVAPVTQDIEHQDEGEGCTDTHPDLNETFDHLLITKHLIMSVIMFFENIR